MADKHTNVFARTHSPGSRNDGNSQRHAAIGETLNQPRYCGWLAGSQLIKQGYSKHISAPNRGGKPRYQTNHLSNVILATAIFMLTFNIRVRMPGEAKACVLPVRKKDASWTGFVRNRL